MIHIDLKDLVAFWGAIVSTVVGAWNIFKASQDRRKLKLSAFIGKMYPDHTDRDYLVLSMANVGRRPILVNGWGGEKKKNAEGKKEIFIKPCGLPRMLKEGEDHIEYAHDLSFLNDELETIHVWDSSGKEWHISRKNFRKLMKDVKEKPPRSNESD
jgi:hypothetical protein